MSDLIFRDYQKGDEIGIIKLLRSHWKHLDNNDALSIWQWEYANSPAGHALIQVAEHEGKIIGHYALIPLEIKYGTKNLLGAKAEGSAVHPDYRGAKANVKIRCAGERSPIRIFDTLIRRAIKKADEQKISLIYGLPLENALKPQLKAGYNYMCQNMVTMILPLNAVKTLDFLLHNKIKNPYLRNIVSTLSGPVYRSWTINKKAMNLKNRFKVNIVAYPFLTPEIDDLWRRYSEEEKNITIKRDKRYLQWRFLNNPVIEHKMFVSKHGSKITGYIIVTIKKRFNFYLVGDIVDFLFLRSAQNDAYFLIQQAISYFKKANADFGRVWLSTSSFNLWRHAFVDNGFHRLFTANLDIIIKSCNTLNPEQVLNRYNWFITAAFTEGVT
ncbi:MAG: GNAT family N-acetyltransferase [Candidatus Bathyarchaeota archaeon]|nr:GNAT family N-acetyltransferase [Candidatus Bathyarchaeota archaeon]